MSLLVPRLLLSRLNQLGRSYAKNVISIKLTRIELMKRKLLLVRTSRRLRLCTRSTKRRLRKSRRSCKPQLKKRLFSSLKKTNSRRKHTRFKLKLKRMKRKSNSTSKRCIASKEWAWVARKSLSLSKEEILHTPRMLDLTHFWRIPTTLSTVAWAIRRKLLLTIVPLVALLFTWESKLLQLPVMTVPGRFGTWKPVRTLWLVKVTKTGSVVSISILLALTWSPLVVIVHSNFGTSWTVLLLTLLMMFILHLSGRSNSMTLVISFCQPPVMELWSFLIWMH